MSKLTPLWKNRLKRLAGYAAGIALFYAPFALLIKGVGLLFPVSAAGTGISDVHTACLRSPLGWLVQPWMWTVLGTSPLYWLPIIVLPVVAIFFGPLFCGWLCPAGALPEYLGRIVPDRFKFDFRGKVDIVPLRYGFLVGFLIAPFVSVSICCSFCNFTHMQNLVSAVFGNPGGLLMFSTMGVLAALVWIVLLGLFVKGGRGWCLFLCPAGTIQGLASWLTSKLPGTRRMRVDASACSGCHSCADGCPMRAIEVADEDPASTPAEGGDSDECQASADASAPVINHHLCIECQDCASACPSGAIKYGTRR